VASCSADYTIRVFDALSGECVTTMVGHKRPVKEIAMFTDYGSGYSVLVSVGMDRTWRIWDVTSVLNTFFYPPLAEDFEWPDDGTEVLVGRNEVPADNPDFDYISRDGVSKRGSTNAFVRDTVDESDEDEDPGDAEDFIDDDFELSDEEQGDIGEVASDAGAGAAAHEWGRRRSVDKPADPELKPEAGAVKADVDEKADAEVVMPADGIQDMNPVPEPDPVPSTDPCPQNDRQVGAFLTVNTALPDIDEVTPPPSSTSSTIGSVGAGCALKLLTPKDMLKHSEHLQDKFVTALATVEIENAREKSRQASNLSQRLSTRRNQSINTASNQPDILDAQRAAAAATGVNIGESSGGGDVTPTPPVAVISTSTLTSPLARRRGQAHAAGADEIAAAGDQLKDQLKKEHEIHTTRHKSRMSMAQTRAASRLAQRLSTQAKKKFKQLSETERQQLQHEGEGNSDDDYDGNDIIQEEDDEDDD